MLDRITVVEAPSLQMYLPRTKKPYNPPDSGSMLMCSRASEITDFHPVVVFPAEILEKKMW